MSRNSYRFFSSFRAAYIFPLPYLHHTYTIPTIASKDRLALVESVIIPGDSCWWFQPTYQLTYTNNSYITTMTFTINRMGRFRRFTIHACHKHSVNKNYCALETLHSCFIIVFAIVIELYGIAQNESPALGAQSKIATALDIAVRASDGEWAVASYPGKTVWKIRCLS